MNTPVSSRRARCALVFSFALAVLAPARAADAPPPLPEAIRTLLAEKKFPEAQAALEQLAAAEPKNVEAKKQLGELAFRRGDAEKAVAYYEQVVQLEPKSSPLARRLGEAYGFAAQKAGVLSKWGLAKKCLAAFQRAVELDPQNVDAHYSLFDYYRQAPGVAGGGTDKALAEAAAIKRLDAARGRIAFATVYAEEKQFDRALAEFDEVLKTNPDDYVANYQVGRLASVTGQFVERGLVALRHCLELTPTPGFPPHAAVQWRLGTLLEKKNDKAGARAAYEAALQLDPKFSAAAEALKKLK
jgi:tetratricopeptide (TPR) repeat protein